MTNEIAKQIAKEYIFSINKEVFEKEFRQNFKDGKRKIGTKNDVTDACTRSVIPNLCVKGQLCFQEYRGRFQVPQVCRDPLKRLKATGLVVA